MTWSIIARDKDSGCFGIAVATKFFAAGARVPFIAAGIGAIATQALINPFYGTNGLRFLREGRAADAVVKVLVAADAGRDHRQIHVIDASGHVAAHTGAACIECNGHIAGEGFSVAGNMLAGVRVLEETATTYLAREALPFPRRLIVAMLAGEAAGGDKRGKQSAALLIYGAPEQRVDEYPHKLSGGMRQRAMVAIALACDPQLLIADEPTTALDVTIQAQVLDLMRSLKEKTNAAIILISHDLGVIAEICDEVAVMYAGEIVEHAPVDALFTAPQHPYTIGLLASIPRLDRRVETLATIEGSLPDMREIPQGCRFAPRCPFTSEACVSRPPPIVDVGARHWSRCLKAPLEGLHA